MLAFGPREERRYYVFSIEETTGCIIKLRSHVILETANVTFQNVCAHSFFISVVLQERTLCVIMGMLLFLASQLSARAFCFHAVAFGSRRSLSSQRYQERDSGHNVSDDLLPHSVDDLRVRQLNLAAQSAQRVREKCFFVCLLRARTFRVSLCQIVFFVVHTVVMMSEAECHKFAFPCKNDQTRATSFRNTYSCYYYVFDIVLL